eukprot:scaffold19546_cov79-Phaeocystis_antarctica.AAC.9
MYPATGIARQERRPHGAASWTRNGSRFSRARCAVPRTGQARTALSRGVSKAVRAPENWGGSRWGM